MLILTFPWYGWMTPLERWCSIDWVVLDVRREKTFSSRLTIRRWEGGEFGGLLFSRSLLDWEKHQHR